MVSTTFSSEALHELIDLALEDRPNPAGSPPGPDTKISSVPLGLHDTKLFSCLASSLETRVGTQACQEILAELRSELVLNTTRSLPQLHTSVLNCRRCPELSSPASMPLGNLVDPDVVFISDNQELSAEWKKRWIALVETAGFPTGRWALTAATRCGTPARRPPSETELSNCSSYLFAELNLLAPRLIVPLGAAPTAQILGPGQITEMRGQLHWLGPWAIMAMYSPAYAQRSATAYELLSSDLASAKHYLYAAS